MNLVNKLLSIDKGEFAKGKTAEYRARKLSEFLGEEVMVKVKALSGDQYVDISARMINDKGKPDYSKVYDGNALIVAEGVIEPDLKDGELQKHFGTATPKELAKVLFPGGELAEIAGLITEISGFGGDDKETEEEIKN